MAFLQFADTQYIKTLDTLEEARVGSFQVTNNQEIQYIRMMVYINNTDQLVGNEQFRLNLYGDLAYSDLIFQSSYSNISDITNLPSGGDGWLGWVRLDFNRENLNKDITYYPTITTNNYTRSGSIFYIGFAFDFPWPVYDNNEDLYYDHPLAMQIFGHRDKIR